MSARPKLSVLALEDRTVPSGTGTYSIDGSGNNPQHPTWGSTGINLLRTAPAAYTDHISSPAGADRLSIARSATSSRIRETKTSLAIVRCPP